MKSIYVLALALLLIACAEGPSPATAPASAPEKPNIIFDTDIGGDIDDLGALWALHTYANSGRCEIAGVMSSWPMEHHVAGIDAVNTWFGRPDVPVGRFDGEPFSKEEYTWYLAQEYESDLTYETAPGAADLYRKLLAEAPDTSITIVTVGRINNLYRLFKSEGDEHSPLNGTDLANQKVKAYFMMGGGYPEAHANEVNFRIGGPGVTKFVVENSTRPMTFNGGKIGNIKQGYGTGMHMNELAEDNPLRKGYQYFFSNPPDWAKRAPADTIPAWSTWDIITVQLAVTGPNDYFEVIDRGCNSLNEEGLTSWSTDVDCDHRYVKPKLSPERYAEEVLVPLLR